MDDAGKVMGWLVSAVNSSSKIYDTDRIYPHLGLAFRQIMTKNGVVKILETERMIISGVGRKDLNL